MYAGDETDPHWEQARFSERATRERTGVASHTNTEAGRQAGDDNNSRFYSGGSVHVVVVVNSSAHIGTMYVDSKRIVNRWNASKCTRRGSTNLQNVQIWMPSPGWLYYNKYNCLHFSSINIHPHTRLCIFESPSWKLCWA